MGFCSNEMSILFWHTHTMSRPMRKKSAILFWNHQLRKNLRKVSKIDRNWISINSKKTSNLGWDSKPSRIGLVLLPGWPWGWNGILRISRWRKLSGRCFLERVLQINHQWITNLMHWSKRVTILSGSNENCHLQKNFKIGEIVFYFFLWMWQGIRGRNGVYFLFFEDIKHWHHHLSFGSYQNA